MLEVNEEKIKKIFPRANHDFIIIFTWAINNMAKKAGIDSCKKLAMFLANVKHEVGFRKNGKPIIRESLNYRREVLVRLSKRFRHNPSLLNKAMSLKGKEKQKFIAMNWYGYGKKAKILGNKEPIDGWRYRGFGLLQITGRRNHEKVFRHIEELYNIKCFDENGEILKSMYSITGAILSAFAFWDLYVKECNIMKCTINKINRGLPDKYKQKRIKTYKKILSILSC